MVAILQDDAVDAGTQLRKRVFLVDESHRLCGGQHGNFDAVWSSIPPGAAVRSADRGMRRRCIVPTSSNRRAVARGCRCSRAACPRLFSVTKVAPGRCRKAARRASARMQPEPIGDGGAREQNQDVSVGVCSSVAVRACQCATAVGAVVKCKRAIADHALACRRQCRPNCAGRAIAVSGRAAGDAQQTVDRRRSARLFGD